MTSPLRPRSVRLAPTAFGRALLLVELVAFVLAWLGVGSALSLVAMLGGAASIVAALASWMHASALRIGAPPPVTAFSGERFVLDVPVANLARRAAAYDVLVTPDAGARGEVRLGALLPRLAAGDETRIDVVHPALRRGLHPQGTLELASAFPLGLWTCRLRFDLPDRILVLPRLGTLRRVDVRPPRAHGAVGHGGAGRGDEQEVYGVRDWREGESLRPVHWKLSARRGRLLAREFRSEPRPRVHVVLETALPDGSKATRDAFEDAVSLAATLVEHKARTGHAVRLTLLGRDARTVACRRGRGAVFPVLRALAEVMPAPAAGVAFGLAPRARRLRERTYVVRVGDGPPPLGMDATVLDVKAAGLVSVFDRRRRPGHELLLGVRR